MNKKRTCIGLGIFALIGCIITQKLKQILYFYPTKDDIDHEHEDFYLDNLHGIFTENKSDKMVIFCHGNGGNVFHRTHILDKFKELNINCLIFDYSGYGKSIGKPSEKQFYEDASKVVKCILDIYDKDSIILYGESIGCPVASFVANKYKIPKLILQSGPSSIKDVVQDTVPNLWFVGYLCPEFNTYNNLKKYKGKSLLMHSKSDEIVSYRQALKMKPYVTKFVKITGTHNYPEIDWNLVKEFIYS